MTNLALFINEINVLISTDLFSFKIIFPPNSIASLISLGPGAKRLGYLFL